MEIQKLKAKPTCNGEETRSVLDQSSQFYPCICELLHHCSIQPPNTCLGIYQIINTIICNRILKKKTIIELKQKREIVRVIIIK